MVTILLVTETLLEISRTLLLRQTIQQYWFERPKIDYFNTGIVGWQGVNGLVEYSDDASVWNAVLQAGYSNQSFPRQDFFDQPANPISETQNQGGGYIKGGANWNFSNTMNVFSMLVSFQDSHYLMLYSQVMLMTSILI